MKNRTLTLALSSLLALASCSSADDSSLVCQPADQVCFVYSEFVLQCRDDGSGWDPLPCDEGSLCFEGQCQPMDCLPGELRCDGGGRSRCLDDGSGWEAAEPCAADTRCHDGDCLEVVCTGGDLRCSDENAVERCLGAGTGWEVVAECADDQRCVDGLCLAAPCSPGATECAPETLYTCSDDGQWDASPCPEGQPCIFGRCVQCLGPADCVEGEDCVDGLCQVTAPRITTDELPVGSVGAAYSATLTSEGGLPPLTWTRLEGVLPPGLTLTFDGLVTGTPEASGQWSFTVEVSDAHTLTDTTELSIEVLFEGEVRITTRSLPTADHGLPYSAALEATGGLEPFAWQLLTGALPEGLTMSATGVIAGTPDEIGSFPLSFRVLDAATPPNYDVRDLELVVEVSPLEVVGETEYNLLLLKVIILPTLVPFIPYSSELQASGGVRPYEWTEQPAPDGLSWLIADWGLPEGLTLGPAGQISGWVTDVSDAQTITIPFGPELAGYFFFARVTDSQSPADTAEAIFCLPTIPL